MPAPSYTYTLTNGTTADASQVQQNFTDILNGVSDGTKNLSISALTCAGTATLNGDVNIGDASADTLIILASLGGTIPVKTDNSFNIGSSSLRIAQIYAHEYYGTKTNDNATTGFLGEYAESVVAAANITTADTAQDVTSLTLPGAGDYEFSCSGTLTRNGATILAGSDFIFGIGSATGTSLTNFTAGVTGINNDTTGLSTTFVQLGATGPNVRIKSDGTNYTINGATVSSSQVVYLKVRMSFTAGNPQIAGILRWRRAR